MKQYIYTPSLYTHTEPSHIHTSSLQKHPHLLLFLQAGEWMNIPFYNMLPQTVTL